MYAIWLHILDTFFGIHFYTFHVLTHNTSQIAEIWWVLTQNVKDALVKERERLYDLLKEIPFLKPFPSHSNFILCEVTSGLNAKKLKVHSFLPSIPTYSFLYMFGFKIVWCQIHHFHLGIWFDTCLVWPLNFLFKESDLFDTLTSFFLGFNILSLINVLYCFTIVHILYQVCAFFIFDTILPCCIMSNSNYFSVFVCVKVFEKYEFYHINPNKW